MTSKLTRERYPLGFNCQQPSNWTSATLPTNWGTLHEQESPSTPYSIIEFQGGSFDPWGGYGFDNCAALTNEQFERIFYKNNWSFLVKIPGYCLLTRPRRYDVVLRLSRLPWTRQAMFPIRSTVFRYIAAKTAN